MPKKPKRNSNPNLPILLSFAEFGWLGVLVLALVGLAGFQARKDGEAMIGGWQIVTVIAVLAVLMIVIISAIFRRKVKLKGTVNRKHSTEIDLK